MADAISGGRSFLIHVIYDLAFLLLIAVAAPYLLMRLALTPRYRAGLLQRAGFIPRPPGGRRMLWIHGVSVGEVKTIQPLLKKLEDELGPLPCAISSTTQAGYQIARRLFPDKFTFYFPLDISFIVRRVIRRVRPALVILMELEIWPNLLYEANKQGVEVIIVNGRISEKSFRGYRRIKSLLPELNRIALFSVQNEEYRRRLLDLDVDEKNVIVSGNIKYDGIDTSEAADSGAVRRELCCAPESRILVAGSTHRGEDDALLQLYRDQLARHPGLRLIIAPRHLQRLPEIEKACQRLELKPRRRTLLAPGDPPIGAGEVLIVDTIGELEKIYAAADLVFVGGSLADVGGHNMLEPAGKGKAVVYGPYVYNFREEAALLEGRTAAIRVADEKELAAVVGRLLASPGEVEALGRGAFAAVAAAKGAAAANVALIRDRFSRAVAVLASR